MDKIFQLTAGQLSVLAKRHPEDSRPMELISGDGKFNLKGLTDFIQSVELGKDGVSYAVIAIMGPQSSGKSTLLNHLFHTKFAEMDSNKGRSQTTKGIWIAKAPDMEPSTVILDMEGTDGQERGEDGTTFEKQSALFALEVADIVIINLWCMSIGLERAAHRPLLKTIFEVKTMGLFSPRKTTLLFVIRDKSKAPIETLQKYLIKDVNKIWEVVPKHPGFKDALLTDFFDVKVIALSNYKDKQEQFKAEVAYLRQQFFHSMPPVGDRQGVVPASGFASNAKKIWEIIKQNEDLDLPPMKVMISTVRCHEIAKNKLDHFVSDQSAAEPDILGWGPGQLSVLAKRHHEDSRHMELISGDGEFNFKGLTDFIQSVELLKDNVSYAVVAIMGPQSSGKSTLLNHLFHTKFTEMDSNKGRSQTTKGICIAKAPDMEPFTMILDLEGTDGQERGEDDKTFEKQSALFALAIADIFIINMWCKDIGLERAANRPLLKTIFEVMMRMRSFPRKTTLHFVIRDKSSKIPFEILKITLIKDVNKIWEVVPKLPGFKDALLTDFFKVEVTALSNYEDKEEQFKAEVAQLRQQFVYSLNNRQGVVPVSGFALSAMTMWETIKQNKDLDLPATKVMISTVRCDEIAKKKFDRFKSDKELLDVLQAAEIKLDSCFGKTISSILSRYLSEYDTETKYYEETVRNEKRQDFGSEAFKVVYPAYLKTLGHLRSKAFEKFKTQLEKAPLLVEAGFAGFVRKRQDFWLHYFDEQCEGATIKKANWDASIVHKQLLDDIQNHTLVQVVKQCQEQLATKLSTQLNPPFVTMNNRREYLTWDNVRNILELESAKAALALSSAVNAFELTDQARVGHMEHDIRQHARKCVENKFKDAARNISPFMTQRFADALKEVTYADMKKKEKKKFLEEAYHKCLKLLSTMAVLRLDETAYGEDDVVERVLMSALEGGDGGLLSGDLLASTTWKGVSSEMTLITPCQCNDIWEQFTTDVNLTIKKHTNDEGEVDWEMVIRQFILGVVRGFLSGLGLGPVI